MKELIREAIFRAVATSEDKPLRSLAKTAFVVESPKNRSQGDFSTNIALVGAKKLNIKPRDLAEQLRLIFFKTNLFDSIETAGPGFLNFQIKSKVLFSTLNKIEEEGARFGSNKLGRAKKVHLEFVSANPTGPLHVGHGRGAAVGSALSRIYQFCGYDVHQEYYVNDAGRQMDILTVSVFQRFQDRYLNSSFPLFNAYEGDYIGDIAEGIRSHGILNDVGKKKFEPSGSDADDAERSLDIAIKDLRLYLGPETFGSIKAYACSHVLSDIRKTLRNFRVHFNSWFLEESLVKDGSISAVLGTLEKKGQIYKKEGALWFKASSFGDEKDRVVIRDGGTHTYFASDIAYHVKKIEKDYDKMIDIWGADHHGYIPRLRAALEAFGINNTLEFILVQFASLVDSGQKIAMSTRKGSFITLQSLIDDVGADAARFFYLIRKADQHMDFDISLAKEKSSKNPVYYIQYACARLSSVLNQAADQWSGEQNVENLGDYLSTEYEREQVLALSIFPDIVRAAANNGEPNLVAQYLKELAHLFHSNYAANKILVENTDLRKARLWLAKSTRQVFENGLVLLDISIPEKM